MPLHTRAHPHAWSHIHKHTHVMTNALAHICTPTRSVTCIQAHTHMMTNALAHTCPPTAHLQVQEETVALELQDRQQLATHVPPGPEALGEGETCSDGRPGVTVRQDGVPGSACVHPTLTHTRMPRLSATLARKAARPLHGHSVTGSQTRRWAGHDSLVWSVHGHKRRCRDQQTDTRNHR